MDRRVTSPTWDPPLPCKQALSSRRVCCSLNQFVFGILREIRAIYIPSNVHYDSTCPF